MFRSAVRSILALLALVLLSGPAWCQSGQTAFGQASVEPAVDYASGNTIFLLTPVKVQIPSKANPRATAPLYLVAYPAGSTVNPSVLNCQPHNCDHVNVLPFPAPGYPNGGSECVAWGLPAGGCSLLIGHDHLVGVPHTGDFNVAWSVVLVVFTQAGIDAGMANNRVLTLVDMAHLIARGYAFEAATPIVFNCSVVSPTVYYRGTPQTF
jgi:hypothetical protein